ncbi:GNAT family N-acetyltransferase [Polycladidibacter hongkongensis]|uniref:GNAT family N-acetyltransferase n=1 Tax=Polycladidibacter hongkongensis TaxID=1647556 RepID=UPI000834C024|nr:GNAT family N-acetyltransferase [Pseudovibrio hongkongensis]
MDQTLEISLDGTTDIPLDRMAFVVTNLEMLSPPQAKGQLPEGMHLERQEQVTTEGFLAMFRAVGTPWLWFGRLQMSEQELSDTLQEDGREVYFAKLHGTDVGLLELKFSDDGDVEVVYFGLIPEAIGGGRGRWMMEQAIAIAFSRDGTKRLWLHTCTGDSPVALKFYMACGFKPVSRSIELVRDPRLDGVLPKDTANHLPLLGDDPS